MAETTEADRLFDLGDEHSGRGARALQAGDTEGGREHFRNAIAAYEASLAAAPEEEVLLGANLKLRIGARRFSLGERSAAVALYEDALASVEARPELLEEEDGRDLWAQAKLNRAEARLTAGDAEAAKTEIEEILAALPDHPYGEMLRARLPD